MRYEVVRRMLEGCYPGMYLDERDVLNTLFFTNGNGYEWIDGELEYVYPYKVPNGGSLMELNVDEYIAQYWLNERAEVNDRILSAESFDLDHLLWEWKRLDRSVEEVQNAEWVRRSELAESGYNGMYIREDGEIIWPIYPLSRYSLICCMPDDIKGDWLCAARRVYNMVGVDVIAGVSDIEWLDGVGIRLKELESKRGGLKCG